MEPRMVKYGTSEETAWSIIEGCEYGMLATVNEDGSPYVVPVNHVCHNGRIYIHGREQGTKISNILRDPRVCFSVASTDGYQFESELACDTETVFRSAVVEGTARMIEDIDEKAEILRVLSDRFGREGAELSMDRVAFTSVMEITTVRITGKIHPRK